MKKKKVIIAVTLLLLVLLCCWLSFLDLFNVRERKQLEGITTSNIDIRALLIRDEFLGDHWKLVETDFLWSSYAHRWTVEQFVTKMYDPVSGERGMIYQEVFKAKNAYAAWVLFDRPLVDSDQDWVDEEENFVEMEHHADQWYLSCADIFEGRRNCSLMARYTDIVVFVRSSFYPEDFSQEKFIDLARYIDETAGDLGLYEP
ncbi:MAG: hypothetical protein ACOYKD_00010 [Anaerolineaceae bacterium]|jgi:hypothetical protein